MAPCFHGRRILLFGLLLLLAALPLTTAASPAPALAPLLQQPPPSAALRFEHLAIEQGLSQSTVSAILQDSLGFMWFGTDDGLNRYDGYRFTIFQHDPDDSASLSQGGIQEIYEDRTGALWVRTSSGGLDRYDRDRNRFVRYRRDDGGLGTLAEDFVWDLYEDRSGGIWAGTYLSGLFRYDRANDRFIQFRHDPANPDSLSDDRVYAIYEDRVGLLWIGTAKGLDRFDREPGRFMHFRHDPADPTTLAGERVQLIYEDRAERLWIATYGTGLNLFDRASGRVTRYVHDPQNPQSIDRTTRIAEIYEDATGYLWMRYSDGRLDRFNPQQGVFQYFRHDPTEPDSTAASAGLGHDDVSLIGGDRNGNVWVGTLGGGLDRYDPEQEQFIHYRHVPYDPTSLSDNQILSFYEDRAGGLWIGTLGHGLNRFDPAQLKFPHYRVDPQALDAAENNIVLDVREDSFEFEFASLSYSQPDKNRYAYMLTPFEQGWTHVGSRRYGSYTNLPGGTYTLRLKAANREGVWNEEGASLGITVIPPFWETWPFRGLLLLVLAALAVGAYRWRVASIEGRSRQLAMDVAERTLTIAGQTADLEALYQADEELERHVQLDQVLQALVDIAVDRLHADKSAVLAWDDRHERLAIRVARNFSARAIERLSFAPDEGFVGQVLATGGPITVADAAAELSHVPERPEVVEAVLGEGIRSFMHIPIRLAAELARSESGQSGSEVFGVFNVSYDTLRAFGGREQRLFTALAQRAALAVQNAQHFAAEQRRAEQFRVIGEVGRGLASILDINELLNEIVRLIQKAFGYDHVGLALIEGDEAVYRVGAGKLWDDPGFVFAPSRLKVGAEGITGWVAGSGEPLLAPDVSQEPHYVWMRGSSTRSELAVPLKVAGKVIGVLDAQSERLNAFDESDLTVMQSLANQAAIAIENARLYERMGRQVAQLTALQETNRAVAGTLERDALLKLIMTQATTLLQADGGLINLVDWEAQEDEVVACGGAAAQFQGVRGPLNASLSGWVTIHNQPIISNHLEEDDRIAANLLRWLEQARVQSAAVAPLTIKDRVVGTLALIKEAGKGGFDQGDLNLLVAFADQAAIAIENAWLYEEARQVAASQERSRLARDLHDAVTQTLFSASLIAEVLPALWENDQVEGHQLLAELRQLTRGALAEMRTLLLELRPAALVEANLGDLLRQLTESISGRTGIPIAVALEGCLLPDLPDEVHVALYRIAQEALNNVTKHARAKRAEVALICAREVGGAGEQGSGGAGEQGRDAPVQVVLRISDDGRGFDPAAVSPDHLGLGIISERAQAISATLRIESRVGRGTVVEVAWNSGGNHAIHTDSRPYR